LHAQTQRGGEVRAILRRSIRSRTAQPVSEAVFPRNPVLRAAALALLVLGLARDAGTPPAPTLRDAPLPIRIERVPLALDRTRRAHEAAPNAPMRAIAPASEWSQWLQAANDGDPGAACRLAAMLDDCRLEREVDAMVETQVLMAAAGASEVAQEAGQIASLQATVEAQRQRCAVLPAPLLSHDADFLLRAALAGHEPSMLRYIVDPPLALPSAVEREAALAMYRQHAPGFLDALLRRDSVDALALAFRIAQGEEFVAGAPVRARDAAAAARYGTALLRLREDDAATLIGVETALSEIDTASAHRAQSQGQALAQRLLQRDGAIAMRVPAADECASGWPGRERALSTAAY
jgi:hypothetical protein